MKKYFFLLLTIFAAAITLPTYADALKDISLDYCDTTGNILQYTIEPGVQTGICYTLNNNSSQPVTMKINFIDGTFTNDQRQNRACLDEVTKTSFGQYVSKYTELVTLTGGESKKYRARLFYPTGTDGQYYGCVSYSVVAVADTTSQENSNFSILMRKAKFIDVLVGHPENIVGGVALKEAHGAASISPNTKIRIYQDTADNKYVIEFTVQNIGGIEENIIITGVASNMFNYKYTFTETRKLLKGQEFIITKKLEDSPNYYMDVAIKMAYTPVISGRPDLVPETSYLEETARIYIFNTITIITLVGLAILLLLIFLLFKKNKKQKNISGIPTTAPTPSSVPPTISK